MHIKNLQMKSLLLLTLILSMSGCAQKSPQSSAGEISKQPHTTALLTSAQPSQTNTLKSFPSQIKEQNGKVTFDAPIVISNGADISKLTINSVSSKPINKDAVYNQLFKGVNTVSSKKGEAGGSDSYEGSKGETLVVNGGGITYFSDQARPVLRAFNPSRASDHYNVDKYASNTDFAFADKTQALNQIISQLSQFGIDLGNDYGYHCYSLDYQTMKSQEYAIDKNGKEDRSIYKKDWNADDDCYYFCIWQTCQQLPVAYTSNLDMEGGDAPIQVIYSKRGIEYLTTQMTFNFAPGNGVVLADIDKIKNSIYNKLEVSQSVGL